MHVYGCNDEALADSSSQVWHGGYLQIIQVIRLWLSVETHGDLGIPHLKKNPWSTLKIHKLQLCQLETI